MWRQIYRHLAAVLLCLAACSGTASPDTPSGPQPGTDGDRLNGSRIQPWNTLYGLIADADGKGVRDVPVTDGYNYVKTDRNGVYQMKADPRSTHVWYSLPSGYAVAQDPSTHLPSFWQTLEPGTVNRRDFTLQALRGASDDFSFAVLGDIHIRDKATADRFRAGALAGIRDYFLANGSRRPMFGLSLGDIINNARDPETYAYAAEALGSVTCPDGHILPFFTTIGNHDHNARRGDVSLEGYEEFDDGAVLSYKETFGPTCYSFNIGKVHFIVLDNYIALAPPSKETSALAGSGKAGLSEYVYDWLLKDLSFVQDKEERMVVLCQHCHMRNITAMPHYSDLVDWLSAFHSAYLFTGHAHICESYKYRAYPAAGGRPVMERIHGVPMGNFWYSRYNPDGASAGYYIYHVSGNEFSEWEYRCVGDNTERMRVYDAADVYDRETDWSHQFVWTAQSPFQDGNYLLAHIYHGDEDWEVWLECDGKRLPMTFADTRISDYCVNCHLANDGISGIRTSWKYHWDRSENWWYVRLDSPVSELGEWKVVAKARFPGSSVTRTYSCSTLTRSLKE